MLNVVATVTNGRLPAAVVEAEAARGEIEQAAGKRLGDVRDAIFHIDSRAAEQIKNVRCDANAGVFDEVEGFMENAFDEGLVEQLKFWSHAESLRG